LKGRKDKGKKEKRDVGKISNKKKFKPTKVVQNDTMTTEAPESAP